MREVKKSRHLNRYKIKVERVYTDVDEVIEKREIEISDSLFDIDEITQLIDLNLAEERRKMEGKGVRRRKKHRRRRGNYEL